MNILQTIGQPDEEIEYLDRPTVKVVIKKDDKVLLLNDGLLPGGGIDAGESDNEAITRELREELGVTVEGAQEIGTIIQSRNFLEKKYVIRGYTATIKTTGGVTDPQDEGEASFVAQWFTLEDAITHVTTSIKQAERKPMSEDVNQGKLYNLMTTLQLLRPLTK